MQGAAVDTLPRCAAACDLRDECVAFSHTTESPGGVCKLHGTLSEGLIPNFAVVGEFTLDPHHSAPEQARHSHILESTSLSLVQLVPPLVCVGDNCGACLQAIGESGNTVCMRKLVRGIPLARAEGSCVPRAPLSFDVAKLRIAAHRLFVVNGSVDTMAYNDVPLVDTIDRQLTVAFDLPELKLTADAPSPFNATCGRSWRCECLRYEVCPGMELTTAMTRDFATITDANGGPPNLTVRNAYESTCDHFMHTI